VHYHHLTSDGGACGLLSYFGRRDLTDIRLARRFDHRHLAIDLVHEEVLLLGGGVSPAFSDVEFLANAIDEVEAAHVRTKLSERIRPPLIGAAVTAALPPDDELTLAEAIELSRRIAQSIAGDRSLAIHLAIHDPAQKTPGARNRHIHLFFHRRLIRGDELDGPVIRDMFAHPLKLGPDGQPVMVEKDRWPHFYWGKLQAHFAELGLDLVVDPIALFPGKHRKANVLPHDPRVGKFQNRIKNLNLAAIHGDPVKLITGLLRGRGIIQIQELQRFIDKVVDNEGDRRARLEVVLAGPDRLTYASDAAAIKPRYITTVSVNGYIRDACDLVDRAAHDPGSSRIRVVTAANHAGVLDKFAALEISSVENPLLLGNNHSASRKLASAIAHRRPVISTIKAALSNKTTFSPERLVVVSRAESVLDLTLAKLILTVNEQRGKLVLLHDQSKETGIASHRLAAYATDQLATVEQYADSDLASATERLLRAGLIGSAAELLAQQKAVTFGRTDDPIEDSTFDFVVCDDLGRRKQLNEALRSRKREQGGLGPPVQVGHPLKPHQLSKGEWIVFTRTDYSVRPPRIIAGELAQILEIDVDRGAIRALLADGHTQTIDPKRFTHFRSAHALLIREATNLKQEHRLQIEVTNAHHVWAAMLLAARRRFAKLIVDPRVAVDIPSLITAASASLPAALPHQLVQLVDPDAEIAAIFNGSELSSRPSETTGPEQSRSSSSLQEVEDFPEPTSTNASNPAPRPAVGAPMHERARAVVDANSHTRRGFMRLCEKLSQNNPDRDVNAQHILSLCSTDGPTAALVKLLVGRKPANQKGAMENLDLPDEIEEESPRSWSEWDLYCLRMDLSTMQFDFASWTIAPKAPAPWSLSRADE
jgi:hypothetical protein